MMNLYVLVDGAGPTGMACAIEVQARRIAAVVLVDKRLSVQLDLSLFRRI